MNVLVAGIGNVFMGDDGFGVAVAQRLAAQALPRGTRVVDFGIRGLHLAFELLNPPDLLVVVDTHARHGEPGTLYLIEPDLDPDALASATPDAHSMDPVSVFASAAALGGKMPKTRIVGCEPATLDEEMGLSAPVERAVGRAVTMIHELIRAEARS